MSIGNAALAALSAKNYLQYSVDKIEDATKTDDWDALSESERTQLGEIHARLKRALAEWP